MITETKPIPALAPAAGSGRVLYIVACSSTKNALLSTRHLPARIAYAGQAFLAARKYLEGAGAKWVILSAKYGILWPGDQVGMYDDRLTKSPWSGEWEGSLDGMPQKQYGRLMSFDRYVMLGGRVYAEHAEEILGRPVERPLAGMGIGQQIATLRRWGRDESPNAQGD